MKLSSIHNIVPCKCPKSIISDCRQRFIQFFQLVTNQFYPSHLRLFLLKFSQMRFSSLKLIWIIKINHNTNGKEKRKSKHMTPYIERLIVKFKYRSEYLTKSFLVNSISCLDLFIVPHIGWNLLDQTFTSRFFRVLCEIIFIFYDAFF